MSVEEGDERFEGYNYEERQASDTGDLSFLWY